MIFYTTESLGPNQEVTPEGFLLCRNVPIARTGAMDYAAGETDGIDPGRNGIARVVCSPEELFKPDTIASFNGKPVVDEHPRNLDDWSVNPDNAAQVQRGVVLNARQGEGDLADCLVADLLVTDADLIKDIQAGKREVSCGYQSKGVQTAPGQGKKTNIVGNHVALVKSGRCGQRCSIKDHSMERNMKKTWKDKVLERLGMSKDADEFKESLEKEPIEGEPTEEGGGTHVHVHAAQASKYSDSDFEELKAKHDDLEKKHGELESKVADCMGRLNTHDEALKKLAPEKEEGEEEEEDPETMDAESKELEKNLAEEAPEGKEEEAKMSKDSSYLVQAFKAARSGAEILAPGIRIPTFDSTAEPKAGFKNVCGLRRKALDVAAKDADTGKMLGQVNGGKAMTHDGILKMSCDEVRTKFNAAVALKRQQNNAVTLDGRTSLAGSTAGKVRTIADLNKANADFYRKNN